MLAPPHPNQQERLATLRGYDILDTPRENDFDEIVELASRICETPISVINLIDEDRQWFKAEVGLGARETPLATSLCSHVILEDDFVEIPDTLQDPRMADNPLCIDNPGLRFYAGARLVAPNGLPIGTLCVLGNEPRELNDLQRDTLRILSNQVMKQLELRLALRNQQVLQQEMDHRVKNSLQTISSIMRMYRRKLSDQASVQTLDAVQRRIDAVAALHQELQGSGRSNAVDLQKYLGRVVALLQESAPDQISVTSDVDKADMPSGKASALAMIVSEFTANAIKHGFPDGRAGVVSIVCRRAADGAIALDCSDDGVGASADAADTTAAGSLGMNLVAAAAAQLNATIENSITEEGGRLSLRF